MTFLEQAHELSLIAQQLFDAEYIARRVRDATPSQDSGDLFDKLHDSRERLQRMVSGIYSRKSTN